MTIIVFSGEMAKDLATFSSDIAGAISGLSRRLTVLQA